MTPDELATAGRTLFGAWWRGEFCRRFRLNPRTLRHMLAGNQDIPAGLEREIREATHAVQ